MKRTAAAFAGGCLIGVFLAASPLAGQQGFQPFDRVKEEAPKVFIDCHQCDMDFIRREITFVNFIRERQAADVHILITIQGTGGGGREYTLNFIGKNGFYDVHNTLKYGSSRTETADEERRGLVRVLKMGLVPYAAKTPAGEFLSVNFEKTVRPDAVSDIWDFWVFNIGMSGNLSGEKTRDYAAMSGSFSANRVTSVSKLRTGLSAGFNRNRFEIDDEIISVTQNSRNLSGLYVVSLDEHWSVGSWFSLHSSSYNNIALAVNPAPAVEYNFYPYEDSTRRQLRLLYRVGYSFHKYDEETIYDKIQENLLGQTLSMTLEVKEPWGNISSSIQGSHFFHDLSLNSLEFWGGVNLHLFRGLALSFSGNYSHIHDQISLPKSEASLEEILLSRRALATNYRYGFAVGLNYTFGSIFSNIVNPRFGR